MNAVQKLFEADHKYFDLKEISSQEYEKMIAPLRDVESVVRCKDCRFDSKCKNRPLKALNDPDWYCAGGVHKEGDGE